MSSLLHLQPSKSAILLLCAILLLPAAVTASYTLTLYDAVTNQPLRGMIVTFYAEQSTGKVITETKPLLNATGSTLVLDLPKGEYVVTLLADHPMTPGRDYLGSITLHDQETRADVLLLPAATIQATIIDEAENLASFTAIHLGCNAQSPLPLPNETDYFGYVIFPAVPVGSCTLLASKNGLSTTTTLDLEQGRFYSVKLQLEQPKSSTVAMTIVLSIFFLAILSSIGWFFMRKRPSFTIKQMKPAIGKRAEDILATLKPKEAEIVQHLLLHNNASLQSHLMHELNIPKTSLSRILEGLQNKNIISCESQGKNKKVTITAWFLGKEEE